MKKLIFIGPLGDGICPNNGASIKNIILKKKIEDAGFSIQAVNVTGWQHNPLIFFRLLWTILTNRGTRIVISASMRGAYRFISIISKFISPRLITYWVIGGALAEKIVQFKFNTEVYKKVRLLIVEGKSMKVALEKIGITNVEVVPNFKVISLPELSERKSPEIKFVFLSRIIPEKGCDLIIEAAKNIRKSLPDVDFRVDFYGPIGQNYEKAFHKKISDIPEVNYMGFLDLRQPANYATLADYDVVLFPTFWPTEGFPGIVIDSMIAGLPIIATDWNMNSEVIKDGVTGFLIPPKDLKSLESAMTNAITHIDEVRKMRRDCRQKATQFDADEIITPKTLSDLGF